MAEKGKWRFRIPPTSKRVLHNHQGRKFRRKDGWYHTDDEHLVEELRSVQLYPNSDDKTPLFEIKTAEEARRIHEAETLAADPAGTPDAPHDAPVTRHTAGDGGGRRRSRRRSRRGEARADE